MTVVFESNLIAERDRASIWHDVIWKHYVPLDVRIDDPSQLFGTIDRSELGPIGVATATSGPQVISRTARLISSAPAEFVMIARQEAGSVVVSQHGREVHVTDGQLVLWDTRRPYDLRFSGRWTMTVFQIPRTAFQLTDTQLAAVTAIPVHADHRAVRLADAVLTQIGAEARDGSSFTDSGIARGSAELVAASLRQYLGFAEEPLIDPETIRARVHDFIRRNLHDPALSVESVARAHHLSVRHLYRVLRGDPMTLHESIRRARLERIRSDLSNPAHANQSIAAIARRWGLTDAPHFSRSFKAEYGMTAQEWRTR